MANVICRKRKFSGCRDAGNKPVMCWMYNCPFSWKSFAVGTELRTSQQLNCSCSFVSRSSFISQLKLWKVWLNQLPVLLRCQKRPNLNGLSWGFGRSRRASCLSCWSTARAAFDTWTQLLVISNNAKDTLKHCFYLSHERYCHSSSTVLKSQFCKLDTKRRRPSSPVESHRGHLSHAWCRCGSYILSDYLIFTRSSYKGRDHTIVSTIRSTPSKHLIIYTACTNLGRHVRGPPHRCTLVQHICEIPSSCVISARLMQQLNEKKKCLNIHTGVPCMFLLPPPHDMVTDINSTISSSNTSGAYIYIYMLAPPKKTYLLDYTN